MRPTASIFNLRLLAVVGGWASLAVCGLGCEGEARVCDADPAGQYLVEYRPGRLGRISCDWSEVGDGFVLAPGDGAFWPTEGPSPDGCSIRFAGPDLVRPGWYFVGTVEWVEEGCYVGDLNFVLQSHGGTLECLGWSNVTFRRFATYEEGRLTPIDEAIVTESGRIELPGPSCGDAVMSQ